MNRNYKVTVAMKDGATMSVRSVKTVELRGNFLWFKFADDTEYYENTEKIQSVYVDNEKEP